MQKLNKLKTRGTTGQNTETENAKGAKQNPKKTNPRKRIHEP